MAFAKIGIMSIGEMGYHWAKLLKARGAEVLTYDRDRSPVTQRRAENAGVKSTASLTELCSSADLIVSIVVPSAALKVAAEIAKAAGDANPKNLIYFDANAISPMTAETINRVVSESGVNFVDGCIIGSASKMDKGAVIYASGSEASRHSRSRRLWSKCASSWKRNIAGIRLQSSLCRLDERIAGPVR